MTDKEIEEREAKLWEHPLVLGKCKKDSEEGEGYTIFKNTNQEMVEKIKALNIPSDTWIEEGGFMNSAKGVSRVEKKLNETQFLCVDEHNHYFIKEADSFKDTNRRNLLQKINDEFSVADAIRDTFGTLYTHNGYGVINFMMYDEYLRTQWDDYEENKERIDDMHKSYDAMSRIFSNEVGAHLDTWNNIVLSEGDIGGSGMFCHLNEDGNIVNRDYNYDIKQYLENKPKTREDLINEILAEIPEGNYEHYGNKWYGDKCCFVMEEIDSEEEYEVSGGSRKGYALFHLTRMEHQGDGRYKGRWSGSVKKPKSAKPSSRDHLLAQILPFVNQLEFGKEQGDVDLSKYINFDKVNPQEEEPAPKKRVQKTKINESKYDVYDWTEWPKEDEDLMKVLEDFSNGIKVGHNEDYIREWVEEALGDSDLPSYSFNKGEKQPNHDKYKGLVKLPHGINLTFKVAEGDACEITWAHSIYYTDVIDLEIVE